MQWQTAVAVLAPRLDAVQASSDTQSVNMRLYYRLHHRLLVLRLKYGTLLLLPTVIGDEEL